jgi:predicted metal-dependent phosphotriesterase family hydrolase
VPLERAVAAIRAVGAEHCMLSSDFGQAVNRPPPEGLATFLAALQAAGLSAADLDTMVRRNPARLLGLDP